MSGNEWYHSSVAVSTDEVLNFIRGDGEEKVKLRLPKLDFWGSIWKNITTFKKRNALRVKQKA